MKQIKLGFLTLAYLALIVVWVAQTYFLARDFQCIMIPTELLHKSVQVQWCFIIILSIITIIAIITLWIGLHIDKKSFKSYGINTLMCISILTVIHMPVLLVETSLITKETSEEKMFHALKKYGVDETSTMRMNFFQTSLRCCGVHNYTDWRRNPQHNCTEDINTCDYVPETCQRNPNITYRVASICSTPLMRYIQSKPPKSYNSSEYKAVEDLIYIGGCLQYYSEYRSSYLIYTLMYNMSLFMIQICGIAIDVAYRKYQERLLRKKQSKSEEEELRTLDNMPSNRQEEPPTSPYEDDFEDEEYKTKKTQKKNEETEDSGEGTSRQRIKVLRGKKVTYKLDSIRLEKRKEYYNKRKYSKARRQTYRQKMLIMKKSKLNKIEEVQEERKSSGEYENDGFQMVQVNEGNAGKSEDIELVENACDNGETTKKSDNEELSEDVRKNKEISEANEDKNLVSEATTRF